MSGNDSVDASADKRLVRVTILQQPYTLRSSGEPGETEALAHYVDDLMSQIAARGGGSDTSRVAVLAGRDGALAALERRIAAVLED